MKKLIFLGVFCFAIFLVGAIPTNLGSFNGVYNEDWYLADQYSDSGEDWYQRQLDEYLKTVPKEIAEEAKMTVPELIRHKGYPAEEHKVITSDGYILTMHRIPHGLSGPSVGRPVVFLQHGIICSSADWIITGPENALGYILADQGYDVWMGNFRGNKYSRNHTSLDPDKDKKKFWDFSWHEMGTIDLPTMIDYVLSATNSSDLFHVGHSQGTTTFYVMTSQMPEYNKKIRAHFSLAPISYMKNMFSPLLRFVSKFIGGIELLGKIIGLYEFLPSSSLLAQLGEGLCADDKITQILCTNTLFVLCGFSPKQMNATILPVLMGHTPAGASTKQFFHYAQLINSPGIFSKFRQYDYGSKTNKEKYGQKTPPSYDLKKVTAPVYLFWSKNDWLSHEKDVNKLSKELKNIKLKHLIEDKKFNHLDYMFGIEARNLLYEKVLPIMKNL